MVTKTAVKKEEVHESGGSILYFGQYEPRKDKITR